jgi:glutaredoxin 3
MASALVVIALSIVFLVLNYIYASKLTQRALNQNKTNKSTNKMANQQLRSKIEATIKEFPVVVYSKTHCPYCQRTKALLTSLDVKGLKVIELDTLGDEGKQIQDELYEITSQRTVPNIFIGGKHIGGNSDIQKLETTGKLRDLLKEAGAL